MTYRNRHEAGVALAGAIEESGLSWTGSLVLGVPRGGVVVAAAVADVLGLPLDVALARKLGAPFNAELAIGAIAEGGAVWINRDLTERLRVPEDWIEEAMVRERTEMERRARRYREGPAPVLDGRSVVVVDDGVATGATLAAVLQALRAAGSATLICAVPVAPPSAVAMLGKHCDAVVCPLQPRRFDAVGSWYRDFGQTSDSEVVAILRRTRNF